MCLAIKQRQMQALRQEQSMPIKSSAALQWIKYFLLFYEHFAATPKHRIPLIQLFRSTLIFDKHHKKNNDEKANIPVDVHMMTFFFLFSWIKTDCNRLFSRMQFWFRYLFILNSTSSFYRQFQCASLFLFLIENSTLKPPLIHVSSFTHGSMTPFVSIKKTKRRST